MATPADAPALPESATTVTFSVGYGAEDPAWDAFLATAPDGHYVQSSLWAKLKETQGWQTRRLIARDEEGTIVAGAQLLLKRFPLVGSIAVCYKAPVLATADPEVEARVVAELHRLVPRLGVVYFTIQPPEGGERMAERLQGMGYAPRLGWGHAPATAVIDLTQDTEQLARRMHADKRRNLRKAQRAGVSVREGDAADLETFYRLLTHTSRRRNFATHSLDFYRHLWQYGAALGQVKLFFAELAGEPLSTVLALCFGDTVYGFKAARSCTHEEAHANALLFWEVFAWAKAHGYRRYDFVGIDSTFDLSFKLVKGEITLDQLRQRNIFKLSFGGDILTSPVAYEYVPNPIVRRLYALGRDHQSVWRLINTAAPLARGMAHHS